jgi:hypothetical protein
MTYLFISIVQFEEVLKVLAMWRLLLHKTRQEKMSINAEMCLRMRRAVGRKTFQIKENKLPIIIDSIFNVLLINNV